MGTSGRWLKLQLTTTVLDGLLFPPPRPPGAGAFPPRPPRPRAEGVMSRLLWELNSAKAATRAAVRLAVVSEPAADDFVNYNAVSELGLGAGESVPATEDGGPPTITCTSAS